jgi:dihydroorotase
VSNVDKKANLLIQDGSIAHIGTLDSLPEGTERRDLNGCLVTPGLFDMHVHLREPGQEEKETILTGSRAAAGGGFTGVSCMANTIPPLDSRDAIEYVISRGRAAGLVHVHPIGALTKHMAGEELTEMADMVEAGAVAFSDDGLPVSSAEMMRRGLEYAKALNVPVVSHAEDLMLRGTGVMNEGYTATRLGLAGIPKAAEDVMVARDLILAEFTGGRLHIAHVSTKGSVDLIRHAKSRGVSVTAETAPHYLLLTDKAVEGYNSNAKMNPPLRTEDDRTSLLEALRDGTIDVIASDHAPHTITDKELEFDCAAFGIVGLETTLGLLLTHLVDKGEFPIMELIHKLAVAPRAALGIPGGKLKRGEPADVTVIDPDVSWKVDPGQFYSKGKNTPFSGWQLRGRAAMTIVNGSIVFEAASSDVSCGS